MDRLDIVRKGKGELSIVHCQLQRDCSSTSTDIWEATSENRLQTRRVFDLGDTKLDYRWPSVLVLDHATDWGHWH